MRDSVDMARNNSNKSYERLFGKVWGTDEEPLMDLGEEMMGNRYI